MILLPRLPLFFVVALLANFCLPAIASASSDEWKPIDPADLALKAPLVQKDADAEAIFWEVRVADERDGAELRTVLFHYLRIKVFNDRGRQSLSKVDIPYGNIFGNNIKLKDIAARTIKADGSIVELKKDDIFERTIIQTTGIKVKAKSFALPNVEAGSIVEYRWREIREDHITSYEGFQLQRSVPVQALNFYLKPLTDGGYSSLGMNAKIFNGPEQKFVKDNNGFYLLALKNLPAVRDEPWMPPEAEVHFWLLVWYTRRATPPADVYWSNFGREVYTLFQEAIKPTDEIKRLAAETIGGAATPEEKLARLYRYCQTKIRYLYDRKSVTTEERAKFKPNKSLSDVLKSGIGTDQDLHSLYAALAKAAGFDARIVRLSNRSLSFFDKSFPNSHFIKYGAVAVSINGQWRVIDPGNRLYPFDLLPWWYAGIDVLVSDPTAPIWVRTPLSSPEQSTIKCMGKFRLSEDGVLDGDVQVEYTGHFAVERKQGESEDTLAQREEAFRNSVKQRLNTAEVSEVKIENAAEPGKPLVYLYHVRVPGYAQRSGKRLFLQPAYFEHGKGPIFLANERQLPIYFHYPWAENEEITIEMPAGFALESPDSPAPLSGGSVTGYQPSLGISRDGKQLLYKRNFFFGRGGTVIIPPEKYAALKNYFDQINKEDSHTITLKQTATTAANP